MSLTVYWNNEDVPKDIEFIEDNEDYFAMHTKSKLDKDVDRLLVLLDKATYNDGKTFLDKFGVSVYWSGLSTGGKTVLNIYYNPDKCFSTIECGINAECTIMKLDRGQVSMQFIGDVVGDDKCDIILDDVHYTSIKLFREGL